MSVLWISNYCGISARVGRNQGKEIKLHFKTPVKKKVLIARS